MKKFKIKNRQKRKYVKKNDLAASYSTAQSLTVGLIPLVLMSIAFFATVIMTTPTAFVLNIPSIKITTPALPEVSMPHVPEVKFAIPDIPKMKTPALPSVSLPKIPIPDFRPALTTFVNNISVGLAISMARFADGLIAFGEYLLYSLNRSYRIISMAISRAFVSYATELASNIRFVGQTTVSITIFFTKTYVFGVRNIVEMMRFLATATIVTLYRFALFIEDIAVQFTKIAIVWTRITVTAIINGFNALVWFLGTPFRALHAYSITLGTILTPYVAFLSEALQQAADDLNRGGENLLNGTVYVSETVEHNKPKD